MTLIRDFGMQVIADRRKNNENKGDLLQLFFTCKNDDGSSLTDEELVDQVINFIVAGRDTTAQALSWAIFCLYQNPHCVEKILEEAMQVVGASEIITYDHVKQLNYAKNVLKETLRLYPSVSRNTKVVVSDDILPNGVAVKKGTMIVYSAFCMGRSKNIWDDPLEFKPERWDKVKPSAFQYPVFNAGPRLCLGKTLAELQGVFVLVTILRKFNFQVNNLESVVSPRSLTLPMKNGLMCTITKRG
jgi:fatty acid omega-hydroxylase